MCARTLKVVWEALRQNENRRGNLECTIYIFCVNGVILDLEESETETFYGQKSFVVLLAIVLLEKFNLLMYLFLIHGIFKIE